MGYRTTALLGNERNVTKNFFAERIRRNRNVRTPEQPPGGLSQVSVFAQLPYSENRGTLETGFSELESNS